MNNSIQFNNVSYIVKNKTIISNISFNISEEGISVLIGQNGSGKTTLLRLMAGLIKPSQGKIIYNNKTRIGFVFQQNIFLNRSVNDNLYHAISCSLNGKNKKDYENIIRTMLDEFNMLHLLKMNAKKLSGGEQQFISLIRSIIINPDVLFLDEPTSNLDIKYKNLAEKLILDCSKRVKVIMVTQNTRQANRLANQVLSIKDGTLNND
jgi:ABC-type multidrug transport system ATPase subunit